ncbi:MAG: alpha/beta hydrolase [Planctomycetota bacterium]
MIALRILLGLAIAAPLASAAPADPPQPSDLTVVHRDGQSFITWTELLADQQESYRIYRHDQPITQGTIAQATLLYEVPRDSGRFYSDRYDVSGTGVWAARYFDRYVIQDGGFELTAGTGLLVWTVDSTDLGGNSSGDTYYAVTTVDSGSTENLTDFGPGNAIGPISESVDEPSPVEVAQVGNIRIFIQYMDLHDWNPTFHAPNPSNGYYGLSPADPAVANAVQYAYSYTLVVPDASQCGGQAPSPMPMILFLHPWQDNAYPPQTSPTNYCAAELRPVDTSETWWFGFSKDHDYRLSSVPTSGETIRNYTEQRVLRMVYDMQRHPVLKDAIDWNRVYLVGHSMGGSGVLGMSLRYPQVFAASYASEPMTSYKTAGDGGGTNWDPNLEIKWGPEALNLPVELDAPGDWGQPLATYSGTGIWDWQDHQTQLISRRAEGTVPIGIGFGRNDTTIEWVTQGRPSYGPLHNAWQPFGVHISGDGHVWQDFQGLPPTLGLSGLEPFLGFTARLNESIPALTEDVAPLSDFPFGSLGVNENIAWSSTWDPWGGYPVDLPHVWRMALRTTDGTTLSRRVTLRRVQRLILDPMARYAWENRRFDGTLVSSGVTTLMAEGLLSLPAQEITSQGNRVTVVLRARPTK